MVPIVLPFGLRGLHAAADWVNEMGNKESEIAKQELKNTLISFIL